MIPTYHMICTGNVPPSIISYTSYHTMSDTAQKKELQTVADISHASHFHENKYEKLKET